MSPKQYTIDELKAIINPIAKKYKLDKVHLFGSYARGDNTPSSDIDLRVDKGELKGYFALSCFYSELEEALDKNIDVLTTGSLSEEFLNDIKKDEILLYAKQ